MTLLASPVARWLGVALALLALLFWAREERAGRLAADSRASVTTQALKANEAALAELGRERDRTIRVLEASAAAAQARAQSLIPVRRMIDAATDGRACVASAPVRAVLDGLRERAAANRAGGAPANPREPAGAGAGAAAAGR